MYSCANRQCLRHSLLVWMDSQRVAAAFIVSRSPLWPCTWPWLLIFLPENDAISYTRRPNRESFLTAVNVGRRVLTADIDGAGTDNDGRQTRLFLVTSTLSLGDMFILITVFSLAISGATVSRSCSKATISILNTDRNSAESSRRSSATRTWENPSVERRSSLQHDLFFQRYFSAKIQVTATSNSYA